MRYRVSAIHCRMHGFTPPPEDGGITAVPVLGPPRPRAPHDRRAASHSEETLA